MCHVELLHEPLAYCGSLHFEALLTKILQVFELYADKRYIDLLIRYW